MRLTKIKNYLSKINVTELNLEDLSNYIKCITMINRYEAESKIRTKIVLKKNKKI